MRTSQDSLVGTVLDGRYRVTSRIARGGMATVYLAIDGRLDREVAVKVMHPHLADDPQFVARFHREARSAARMSHANVVAVFDQGHDGDVVYLVMEYVPGTTLRDLITERGALTAGETLEVIEALLDALSAAHRAGLVHRDVKPENVLITADGRVKVADFGLARAASMSNSSATTGMLMGTAAYLSPELVTRGVADARSDVYAVGIMTFEMLTGRQPYVGQVPIQVAFQHVNAEVPAPSSLDPGLPVAVDEIVTWATARDPDLRPRDAAELRALARRVKDQLTNDELDRIPATPPAPPAPAPSTELSATPTGPYPTRVVGDERPTAPTATDVMGTASPSAPQETLTDGHQHAVPLTKVDDEDDDNDKRRRRGLPILIGLVGLALLLGGLGWYFTAGPGAFTITPQVTGSAEEAEQTLSAAGLGMNRIDEYSDDVEIGDVLRTEPAAGERVRKGGTVDVVVVSNTKTTQTPNIVGKSPEDATPILAEENLELGDTTDEVYSDSIEKGNIVSQTPEADADIERGQPVSIVLSDGPEPISVPNLTGQPAGEAASTLEGLGFDVSTTGEHSESVAEGTVISQDPRSGTRFRGDDIRLVVSQGPAPVAVPNVVTMKTGDAVNALRRAGFEVHQNRVAGGTLDVVLQQTPAGGTAPKGSTVTIRIG